MKNVFRISLVILLIILIQSCKKDKPTPPILTTTDVTEISYTTATSGGDVTNEGGMPIAAIGVCWSTSADPTIANSKTIDSGGLGPFTSKITQLTPNTIYYVRAYAINIAGTGYGNQVTFTTSQVAVPVLTTSAISTIAQTTAISGGNITADNGGIITARGVCWGTAINPTTANYKTTDGTGTGSFVSNLTGLVGNTIYYVRAYATNSAGTSYGNELIFITYTVADIDGNGYNSVTIGTQTWMAENLKTTRYNDGTAIPLVTDGVAWDALSTPGYCWYNNDAATYKATYGALYNWYTVRTGKLCPTGWHIPGEGDWLALGFWTSSGGWGDGGKLKETGTTHWLSPNTGATNESGFTALPGGTRRLGGEYYGIGYSGYWWSNTQYTRVTTAYGRCLFYSGSDFSPGYYIMRNGFSVRCLQDY